MFNESNWGTTHFLFGTHSSLFQFLCGRMLTFTSKQRTNLKDTAAFLIPVNHSISRWPRETPGRALGLTSVVTQWEEADLPGISKGVQVHLSMCVCVWSAYTTQEPRSFLGTREAKFQHRKTATDLSTALTESFPHTAQMKNDLM